MPDIPRARLTKRDKMCTNQRKCSWCGQTLPLHSGFFHRDKNSKGGYKHRCKTCTKILANMTKQSKPYEPYMTIEEHRRINELQDKHRLLSRIAQAARDAEYAADGIVLDGRKLSIPIKVCSGCAVQYPATLDHFNRCKQSKKDGLSGRCNTCINKPRRKRRKANKPKMFSTKSLYS